MGLIVYHAANEPERARRMLAGRFDASDEEALNADVRGLFCTEGLFPWAGLRDGARVVIPHVLALDVAGTEAELEGYADREAGWPSGAYWLPATFLCERVSTVREVDPSLLSSEAFWQSWEDWQQRRQAVVDLAGPSSSDEEG